jgi:hypothetical protein
MTIGSTNSTGSTGRGSDVAVSAGTLNVVSGAYIKSDVWGTGAGGNVSVTTGALTLSGNIVALTPGRRSGRLGHYRCRPDRHVRSPPIRDQH